MLLQTALFFCVVLTLHWFFSVFKMSWWMSSLTWWGAVFYCFWDASPDMPQLCAIKLNNQIMTDWTHISGWLILAAISKSRSVLLCLWLPWHQTFVKCFTWLPILQKYSVNIGEIWSVCLQHKNLDHTFFPQETRICLIGISASRITRVCLFFVYFPPWRGQVWILKSSEPGNVCRLQTHLPLLCNW